MNKLLLSVTALAAIAATSHSDEAPVFRDLFNGKDLTGWVDVNTSKDTWKVRDGLLICSGHPIGVMRSEKQYENFILHIEWRHMKAGGNSGVFIWGSPIPPVGVPYLRGIEVQVLDEGYGAKGKNEWFTTQGDIFPIHGATMKPIGRVSKNGQRSFPSPDCGAR